MSGYLLLANLVVMSGYGGVIYNQAYFACTASMGLCASLYVRGAFISCIGDFARQLNWENTRKSELQFVLFLFVSLGSLTLISYGGQSKSIPEHMGRKQASGVAHATPSSTNAQN